MRIGLDGRFYRSSTAGIGRYTRELVKNLLAIDGDNEYVLFITPADEEECQIIAPNLKKVVTPIKHFTIAEQLELPKLLESHKLDLMHFLNFNHPMGYKGKYITTIHDLTMNFFPVGKQKWPILRQAYLWNMQHAASAANKVIVPTNVVKDDVVKHLHAPADKVAVIYEGATEPSHAIVKPKKEYLAQSGVTKPYILFVSQWRPHKGLGVLVEAFSEIKKKHDIQLVITGKPNPQFPAIPAAIEASPHRKDIITPGFVSDELLDALFAGTELFVFPSWYEGFGLPPLEAMARGTAVASSNTSVMPEILGDAAAYFDPKDAKNMAKVLSETLSDEKKLTELRDKAKKQAAKYSWKKMAEETLGLYNDLFQVDRIKRS